MGITGLLPLLRPVIEDKHISHFRGKRVAVDSYSWLHKAAYACVEAVTIHQNYDKIIAYCFHFIDMLLAFDIDVTLVFDGHSLPAKETTENDRALNRAKNKELGMNLLSKGEIVNARMHLTQALDITPLIAAHVIRACRRDRPNVKCIVAPYEADAQLSFLSINNLVDLIIAEDSDTIPYDCNHILFKLSKDGSCQYLHVNKLYEDEIPQFDLRSFTKDMIVCLCVAAGCDYLHSPQNFGIKTSYKYVTKQKTAKLLLRAMRMDNKLPIVFSTEEPSMLVYEVQFYKALFTFRHQIVFDPQLRKCVHLTTIPTVEDDFHPSFIFKISQENMFCGNLLSDDIACRIADGILDPETRELFQFSNASPPMTRNFTFPQSKPQGQRNYNATCQSTLSSQIGSNKTSMSVESVQLPISSLSKLLYKQSNLSVKNVLTSSNSIAPPSSCSKFFQIRKDSNFKRNCITSIDEENEKENISGKCRKTYASPLRKDLNNSNNKIINGYDESLSPPAPLECVDKFANAIKTKCTPAVKSKNQHMTTLQPSPTDVTDIPSEPNSLLSFNSMTEKYKYSNVKLTNVYNKSDHIDSEINEVIIISDSSDHDDDDNNDDEDKTELPMIDYKSCNLNNKKKTMFDYFGMANNKFSTFSYDVRNKSR